MLPFKHRIGGLSTPSLTTALVAAFLAVGTVPANGQAKSGPTATAGSNSWISSGAGAGNSWIGGSGGSSQGGGIVVGGGGFGGVGAVGSGPNHIDYNPPIIVGFGPYGPIFYANPIVVVGAGGSAPVASPMIQPNPPEVFGGGGGGMMLPMPPKEPASARPAAARRTNPTRAREHVEIGDRSFRGDNTKRAEDRYRLAHKADPRSATPLVRLAQVSLVRGRYAEAARFLREAVAAEPGFLLNAPDIQNLYTEPADFAKMLAELETHLQAEPTDRDAWFVLGAEWYLSGRTQKAADAFQRLTDRKPDLALAAFLDATSPRLTKAAPQ